MLPCDQRIPSYIVHTGFTSVWNEGGYIRVVGVSPRQRTEGSPVEFETLLARAFCHYLIEALPSRANEELLNALFEMFIFYRDDRTLKPVVAAAFPTHRSIKKLALTVRPKVTLPDEG